MNAINLGTGTTAGTAGIVVPMSRLWASAVDFFEISTRQRAQGEALATGLIARGVAVGPVVVYGDRAEAVEAAGRLARVGAIVVLQTMGVQPAFTMALLDALGDVPVVVAAAVATADLPDAFDHASITADGATVGTPMLTSVLTRRGRPFDLVAGCIDSDALLDAVAAAARGALAATLLRRARIAVVGDPIDGYDCVTADPARLACVLGTELVKIEPAEFRDRFALVTAEQERAASEDLRASATIEADGEGLARSVRAIPALAALVEEHRCQAGVMNCHVDDIRFSADVGISPCLALGVSTTRGIPWTCAGDALTAVAMLAVKSAGLPVLYHELESVDLTTGEFVVANTGEHDLTWAPAGDVRVRPNGWFRRDPIAGCCVGFEVPPGPATLVGFVQLDDPARFRFVVAPGTVTERTFPAVGTVNAAFRFAGSSSLDGWRRWCAAGVNHHSVLTTAAGAAAIQAIGLHTGIEVLDVTVS